MSQVRQITFDVIHRLQQSKTRIEIYAELNRCGSVFGYDAFLIGGLPQHQHEMLSDCMIISGWPPEWERRYQDRRYMYVDPVIQHIRRSIDPFLWRDAAEISGSPQGDMVFDEARTFGLHDGLCVPFHQIDGTEAGVSFGGSRYAPTPDERAGLHLIAIYAMSCARGLAPPGMGEDEDEHDELSPLSDRETECLKWASDGKTSWEIAAILSMSRKTVDHHLATASHKLDTVSRIHCVAEAIRRGLIR